MRIRFAHGTFYATVLVPAAGAHAAGTPTGYVYHDLLAPGYTRQVINGGTAAAQVGYTDGAFSHAAMWSGTAQSFVDLHPAGHTDSYGTGAGAGTQVGFVGGPGYAHAAVWFGSAASMVDLHPAGFDFSSVSGAGGNQQVGTAGVSADNRDKNYAALWTGTAASYVNLHPAGFDQSYAYHTNGTQQVGYADEADGTSHAMMWSGTAASAVDLTRATSGLGGWLNFTAGNQQVGAAFDRATNGRGQASLWHGTPESRVDLAQAHWTASDLLATNGTQQVGVAEMPGEGWPVGMVWSGTADSAVDLRQFIPGDSYYVYPTAILEDGTIFGSASFVDFTTNPVGDFSTHPFMLTPAVPEPGAGALMLLAGATLCRRRRRRITPAGASGCCPARS